MRIEGGERKGSERSNVCGWVVVGRMGGWRKDEGSDKGGRDERRRGRKMEG